MSNPRTVRRAGAVPALAAAAALAALAVPGSARASERFTLPGDEVAVYNLAGKMQVVAGRGSQVEAEVARQGRDGGKLKVETGRIGERQTLRVIYPANRVVYRSGERRSSTTVRVRDDGTFDDDRGGRKVTVATWGFGLQAGADVTLYVPKGKQVAVHLGVGEATVSNVEGDLRVDVHAAPVRAEHTRGRLKLDTGSGGVTVSDAQGDVTIDTGSGGVRVSSVRGGNLLVDTGSGGVTGDDLRVERLSVDTGSGGVELLAVSAAEIRLDTGSGHVRLDLRSDVRVLDVDTGSGGVTITVPDQLGADAEIEVGSGGIDIDVPHEVVGRISRDHYRCRIGDGQGRIHIETGSGGVRLRQG